MILNIYSKREEIMEKLKRMLLCLWMSTSRTLKRLIKKAVKESEIPNKKEEDMACKSKSKGKGKKYACGGKLKK